MVEVLKAAYLLLDVLSGGLWVRVAVESSIGMSDIISLIISHGSHKGTKDVHQLR